MPIAEPSAGRILKSIRIRLSPEVGPQLTDERQETVLSALAAALLAINHIVSLAWTVQAVPGADPLLYDLMPLPDHPVSVGEAWVTSYALRDQPHIAAAEPIFIATDVEPSGPATHTPDQSASATLDEDDRSDSLS
jgi:hypothetical protein